MLEADMELFRKILLVVENHSSDRDEAVRPD